MNQAKVVATIENPREYETRVVEQLRRLLQAGAPTQADARRPHFYEIDAQDETYYIHISPFSGNVVLLAKWTRHPQDCCLSSSCAVG